MNKLIYSFELNKAIFKRLLLNFSIYKKETKNKGWFFVIKVRLPEFVRYIVNHYRYKIFKSKRKFRFQRKDYNYIYHPYNFTWINERSLEIPIFKSILQKSSGLEILEIGNVLSHYMPINHDVLDKYEVAKNVINKDASTFKGSKRYDLIISISTLEHIGWDERKKDKNKIPKTLNNLRSLLKNNGQIIFSVPLGFNPYLDYYLKSNKIKFAKKIYYKRLSKDNIWQISKWNEVKDMQFNKPYPFANALLIGFINK